MAFTPFCIVCNRISLYNVGHICFNIKYIFNSSYVAEKNVVAVGIFIVWYLFEMTSPDKLFRWAETNSEQ